jgi:hypothetical protein
LDALGFERVVSPPGRMGNILLLPSEVEAALVATRRAYSGLSPEKIFEVGKRFLRLQASVTSRCARHSISCPEGLEQAEMRNAVFSPSPARGCEPKNADQSSP